MLKKIILVIIWLNNIEAELSQKHKNWIRNFVAMGLNRLAYDVRLAEAPLYNETNIKWTPVQEDVTFWYKKSNGEVYPVLANDSDVGSQMDLNNPFVFIIHGLAASKDTSWVQALARGI